KYAPALSSLPVSLREEAAHGRGDLVRLLVDGHVSGPVDQGQARSGDRFMKGSELGRRSHLVSSPTEDEGRNANLAQPGPGIECQQMWHHSAHLRRRCAGRDELDTPGSTP